MFNKTVKFAEKNCPMICLAIWTLAVITSLVLILAGK